MTKLKAWRTGHKVKLNVYDGDRPVCQCHSQKDAERIVRAVNAMIEAMIDYDPDHEKLHKAIFGKKGKKSND